MDDDVIIKNTERDRTLFWINFYTIIIFNIRFFKTIQKKNFYWDHSMKNLMLKIFSNLWIFLVLCTRRCHQCHNMTLGLVSCDLGRGVM